MIIAGVVATAQFFSALRWLNDKSWSLAIGWSEGSKFKVDGMVVLIINVAGLDTRTSSCRGYYVQWIGIRTRWAVCFILHCTRWKCVTSRWSCTSTFLPSKAKTDLQSWRAKVRKIVHVRADIDRVSFSEFDQWKNRVCWCCCYTTIIISHYTRSKRVLSCEGYLSSSLGKQFDHSFFFNWVHGNPRVCRDKWNSRVKIRETGILRKSICIAPEIRVATETIGSTRAMMIDEGLESEFQVKRGRRRGISSAHNPLREGGGEDRQDFARILFSSSAAHDEIRCFSVRLPYTW